MLQHSYKEQHCVIYEFFSLVSDPKTVGTILWKGSLHKYFSSKTNLKFPFIVFEIFFFTQLVIEIFSYSNLNDSKIEG